MLALILYTREGMIKILEVGLLTGFHARNWESVMLCAAAIDSQVSAATTVYTSHLFTRHNFPDVGKFAQPAVN